MALHRGRLMSLESNVGVSDAVLLDPMTEDVFIENLKERFDHDLIYGIVNSHVHTTLSVCCVQSIIYWTEKGNIRKAYDNYLTYIGNVVVSVNPYRKLQLYTHDVIEEYRSRNIYELPPHIYAIADDAYRSMRDRNLDQCIIISGESGSGKTEASKVIMQYVAEVSGKGQDIDRVKEQLLQSNPVLEAFGNAKTVRNDNSSRFGKYMDIEFDYKGDPIGGVITNYLLEKSRVAAQAKGERNFHIFYQLLAGADVQVLNSLKLKQDSQKYVYLKNGGNSLSNGSDDAENFKTVKNGMEVIGFTSDEINQVLKLVSTVLKLGNIEFTPKDNNDGTDGCDIGAENEVQEVCELLGCSKGILATALTQRTVEVKGDKVKTDLKSADAFYARDALCKALYSRMFSWLVQRINDSIKVKRKVKTKVMGVLDIYGFEVFQNNSFEQFIINYCNEKLQQIFIELTLKEEQEEYVKEGIEWIHVEYFNNAVICDLIEKSNVGILALLDEECLRPGNTTDKTFLNKLSQRCAQHPHYESRSCKKTQSDKSLPHDAFRLRHYAGNVLYKVEGFLDKNNDLLFRDLSQAVYACKHPLLKTLFPEGNPSQRSLKRPATAGSQFKDIMDRNYGKLYLRVTLDGYILCNQVSVTELMKNLLSKNPNYIRCVKPNDDKKAQVLDVDLTRHQVRYLGLMENVRVKRAGYAFRQSYEIFLYRYKMLAKETWPSWKGEPQDGAKKILESQMVPTEEYAFGKSKIFIRNPKTLFDMEERRRDKMEDLAILVQKIWKGWKQKTLYRKMRTSQVIISAKYRGYWAKKCFLHKKKCSLLIQCYIRGWRARRLLGRLKHEKRVKWSVSVIYKYQRGWQARKLCRQLRLEKKVSEAASIIQKYFKGWRVRKQYRSKFRAKAGPKIAKFMKIAVKKQFLLKLKGNLPSTSPISQDWPKCSPLFKDVSQELKKIFHMWRCAKYRERFDQVERYQMKEKVTASDIFKGKKETYLESVGKPFEGDYFGLQQNSVWQRVYKTTSDQHVVFADTVTKVNRANGKMVQLLVAMSTQALLIFEPKAMTLKYRIPLAEVEKLSLSPYSDKLIIFHLQKHDSNGDIFSKKGDFIFCSDNVIEFVTKAFLVVQNHTGEPPEVQISQQFFADLKGSTVEISIKKGENIDGGLLKVIRKGNRLVVIQT